MRQFSISRVFTTNYKCYYSARAQAAGHKEIGTQAMMERERVKNTVKNK